MKGALLVNYLNSGSNFNRTSYFKQIRDDILVIPLDEIDHIALVESGVYLSFVFHLWFSHGLAMDRAEAILKSDKLIDAADSDDSNIRAVTTGDTHTSTKTFEELNLSPELLKGLYSEMGFEKPSKIQAISLPMILTPPYQNLIAQESCLLIYYITKLTEN